MAGKVVNGIILTQLYLPARILQSRQVYKKAGRYSPACFSYWKAEIRIRIGLMGQGEVPPLVLVGSEACIYHDVAEQGAVFALGS